MRDQCEGLSTLDGKRVILIFVGGSAVGQASDLPSRVRSHLYVPAHENLLMQIFSVKHLISHPGINSNLFLQNRSNG